MEHNWDWTLDPPRNAKSKSHETARVSVEEAWDLRLQSVRFAGLVKLVCC